MSEEEKIVDRVSMIDQWKTSGDVYTQDELNAIGELLDLYYKQQKEIEEIRNWKYTIDTIEDLEKLKELDVIKIKGKEYICKDKIKEIQNKYKKEIERLESKKLWNEPVDTIKKNIYTNYYNAYEELLKE